MNFTAAELRAQADQLYSLTWTPNNSVRCRQATALREYADLKEAAENGVTDEVVETAYVAYRDSPFGWTGSVKDDALRAALLAVAPLLALKGDKP